MGFFVFLLPTCYQHYKLIYCCRFVSYVRKREVKMNKEKIMENAQECYESFISSRIEIALLKLSETMEYKDICQKEETDESVIDILLQKMDSHDRTIIKRYIESLSIKASIELKGCYKQGVRDGIKFLDFFKTGK